MFMIQIMYLIKIYGIYWRRFLFDVHLHYIYIYNVSPCSSAVEIVHAPNFIETHHGVWGEEHADGQVE
jgi:hypothetical protein